MPGPGALCVGAACTRVCGRRALSLAARPRRAGCNSTQPRSPHLPGGFRAGRCRHPQGHQHAQAVCLLRGDWNTPQSTAFVPRLRRTAVLAGHPLAHNRFHAPGDELRVQTPVLHVGRAVPDPSAVCAVDGRAGARKSCHRHAANEDQHFNQAFQRCFVETHGHSENQAGKAGAANRARKPVPVVIRQRW